MIKEISEKDKEDWDNFLNNKKKDPNKILVQDKDIKNEKNIKILDKDKEDWDNFIKNKEKIPNKDFVKKKKDTKK